MPSGVLDAVKPFLDHYEAIDGVDYRWCSVQRNVNEIVTLYRKNIFIFLSNTGGKEITDAALSTWREGKPREEISFAQVPMKQLTDNWYLF